MAIRMYKQQNSSNKAQLQIRKAKCTWYPDSKLFWTSQAKQKPNLVVYKETNAPASLLM